MSQRKLYFSIPIGALLLMSMLLFLSTGSANAQCGSQASSCKSCHEVQGEDPVNNDGNGWHESHAFGDFCGSCHAGNVQAPEKEAAHAGLVAPLSDVKAGCQTCHPSDLMEVAGVYATLLGVEIGEGGGSPTAVNNTTTTDTTASDSADTPATETKITSSSATTSLEVSNELDVNDPNLVDYVQRYDEMVLGYKPTNWGNVAFSILIGAVAIMGGIFVIKNERILGSTTLADVPAGYPEEAVALLPKIAKLDRKGRKALDQLLENPDEAAHLFQSVSKLSE